MFILDSLFVSGLRWVLDTVKTAADAEMDDDTALREELMAAEMRREMGEISNAAFAEIEADLLARIRAIKERRDGGSAPIAFGGEREAGEGLQVDATVTGDFHQQPSAAESGTVIEGTLVRTPRATRRAASRAARRSTTPVRKTPRS